MERTRNDKPAGGDGDKPMDRRFINTECKPIFYIVVGITSGLIVLAQTFYWLVANAATPIILGLPLNMFVVTALVVLEFVLLIVLYKFD